MNWLWLNASVGAAFVLPVAGAPLWLVLRYPDNGPCTEVRAGPGQRYRQAAVTAEADQVGLAWPGPLRAEAQPVWPVLGSCSTMPGCGCWPALRKPKQAARAS